MKIIKFDSNVIMHYALKANGVLFESTFNYKPLSLIIGKSTLPQLLESCLYGLKKGDKKCFTFDSLNVFGKYNKDNTELIQKNKFKRKNIKVGEILEVYDDTKSYFVTILKENQNNYLVDLNHPLSNKEIEFSVEILEISDAIE